MDYTLGKYAELCQTVKNSKYICLTLADYLRFGYADTTKSYLIMRHDIDRSPLRALATSKVEHQYGLKASYYFRAQKYTYITSIVDQIYSYGHEIGYHYETLDKCKGSLNSAQELFKRELSTFRSRYNIQTVCAHGNPLTPYDNKDIWENMSFKDCKLIGEAFLSLDFNRFAYFSDSGRTWLNNRSQKMPGKDSVQTAFSDIQPRITDDVIKIVQNSELPNICILTHPERWSNGAFAYSRRFLLDMAFKMGKSVIYKLRWENKK